MEYRRLVASIAAKLSLEDVQKVAFVRLENRNVATGIDLLTRLECLGQFSQDNIDGLEIIVKEINRKDLVREVKHYKKSAKPSKQIEKPHKSTAPITECQEMENACVLIASKLSDLKQQFSVLQQTLARGGDDEGTEIVYLIGEAAQTLAKDAYAAHNKLTHLTSSSLATKSQCAVSYNHPTFVHSSIQTLGEPTPPAPVSLEFHPSTLRKTAQWVYIPTEDKATSTEDNATETLSVAAHDKLSCGDTSLSIYSNHHGSSISLYDHLTPVESSLVETPVELMTSPPISLITKTTPLFTPTEDKATSTEDSATEHETLPRE